MGTEEQGADRRMVRRVRAGGKAAVRVRGRMGRRRRQQSPRRQHGRANDRDDSERRLQGERKEKISSGDRRHSRAQSRAGRPLWRHLRRCRQIARGI